MLPGTNDLLVSYLPEVPLRAKTIYWMLLGGICLAIAWLPFLTVDISIRTTGVVRPKQERFELRPLTGAVIDRIYYREGDTVPRDSPVMRLYDTHARARAVLIRHELEQRRHLLHDLQLLAGRTDGEVIPYPVTGFRSAVYRQEWELYAAQLQELLAGLKKARQELAEHNQLVQARVISRKEYYDKQVENEQLEAAFRAFKNSRVNDWQQQLMQYRSEYIQYELQWQQLVYDRYQYELRAPVTGTLMGIGNRYPGSAVQAGEVLGVLSPEAKLIAEVYVPVRDIGLLREGQPVRYQVEAFDYKYFGTLSGRITHIDHDFTLQGDKPFFKVRADFDSTRLRLENGYAVKLKKGMTFQAGFIVTRRSLWQLLFDTMDDWLNPGAPPQAAQKDL